MKTFTLTLAFALFSTSLFAQMLWKSDQSQSRLGFTVTSMGINQVSGLFKSFEATIQARQEDFSDAVFDLTIDAASIDTSNKRRDNDLRSNNFFDVANLPKITFRSTSITKTGPDTYKLTGDLSMHGVTKSVTIDLIHKETVKDPETKALISGFQVKGMLKRSDFNIGRGFMASMVGDEVSIEADGRFIRYQ
ncbi:YceI family protein [Cesiribacter sp. SM1]|uniref:YceI family protein n=1 Tax=Cesiribacter sp. SM1 TaxID=2861196 RepID=UPI001CD3E257|nr:YceI family protein [Cesiribacter sp. SM1]